MKAERQRVVVSLTTIPPRFKVIAETLDSLIRQSAIIESINLYLPRRYRRFSYERNAVQTMLAERRVCFTEIDYGPATKILPAVQDYRDQDVMLLFCDDDKLYDLDWASRFVAAANAPPQLLHC